MESGEQLLKTAAALIETRYDDAIDKDWWRPLLLSVIGVAVFLFAAWIDIVHEQTVICVISVVVASLICGLAGVAKTSLDTLRRDRATAKIYRAQGKDARVIAAGFWLIPEMIPTFKNAGVDPFSLAREQD